tara:strand:+ start:712 stop:990 length:279 start_codon:yes stop_codon:yes gene_type:complete
MSRTFRTNKYGEIKTDKFKKGFNGCGCAYCQFINTDDRNKHRELALSNEIQEFENYIQERWSEEFEYIDKQDHYWEKINSKNMEYNHDLYKK